MERIAVTGATSMIGSALINEAVQNGVRALAVVRKNSENLYRLPDSELVTVMECELDELCGLEADGQYDAFYHFAWAGTSKKGRADPVLQEKNIKYSLDAAKAAAKLGCRKFIGAGSQAEYGRVSGKISPATRTDPSSSYGIAKYAAGKLTGEYCAAAGIIHIWARVFSVYGTNDTEDSMISYAMRQFRSGSEAQFSAGTQMWDFLNEKDAGRLFFTLGEKVNESRTYCAADGRSRQLKEYIMEMADVLGENFRFTLAEKNSPDVFGLDADISDLQRDTGFAPSVSFREGINEIKRKIQQ